jgi:TonB-dependent receptor
MFVLVPFLVLAQNEARIAGKVTDASTGEQLPGANVFLDGTSIGVATDRFGNYRIEKIPLGTYTLKTRYIGYEEYSTEVTLTNANTTLSLDIQLNLTAVELEDVVVSGLRQGQVKALNQQMNAANIKNVLSNEEMEKFPDMNTAEALQRIPGVAITRSLGEGQFIFLRGTEPRLTNVTVNGQKLATPREQDRFIGLDIVNASQLSSIEVSKANTPDMDGAAIGGTVDLVTRSAFDYEESRLKINLGSGYQQLGGDPLYRGSVNYSTLLGDSKTVGVSVDASWYRNAITSHSNEFDWDNVEDVNGNEIPFALADYRLYNYETIRDHIGFNAQLEFRPSENGRYFVSGMYNRRSDDLTRNMLRYRFDRGDFLNPTTISEGRAAFELNYRNEIQNLYGFTAGGENKFGLLDLDYTFSYSHGEEETGDDGQLKSEFQVRNISYALDLSDRDFPGVTTTNVDQDFLLNPSNWNNDGQDFRERSSSNDYMLGTINLKYPYSLGQYQADIKAGAKITIDQKERSSRRYDYNWRGDDITMANFGATNETVEDFLLDNYLFGPIMEGGPTVDFLMNNVDPNDKFRIENISDDTDGLGGTYDASENIYAGYIMTTINFNNLMVLAGVRAEMTQTTYDGLELLFDDDGQIVSTTDVSNDNDYTNIFPALHLKYKISPYTNLRLAYTQGIARPDYFDLAPYRWIIPDDDEIIAGNPNLEPTEAKNVDLMFGHYFQGIGAINAGVFYKKLDKVIYEVAERIEGGSYDGYDELKKVNGGGADLYGFEISWLQQFTFLPGILSGFGVYANYTYTETDVDLTFSDRDVLPGQAGDVGNFGLSYERDNLTARLSLNYTSEVLVQVESDENFDRWNDERIQLDFSGSYEFIPGYEFYLDVINITNSSQRVYYHVTDRPRENQYYSWSLRSGFKINI